MEAKVPNVNERRRTPMRAIRAVVKQIADKFQPEKIILFGSYAYGRPRPESDVDLLVVMETPLRFATGHFWRNQVFHLLEWTICCF